MENNEDIKKVVSEQIAPIKSKIQMLINEKKAHFENGDLEKAFKDGIKSYGNIDEELCKKAHKQEKENLEILRNKPLKSELEKKLEENKFDAEDLKEYIEFALRKGGLENDFKVVIEEGINNINVTYKAPRHSYNVVLIPKDKVVNGIELPQKLAHEITHVISHTFSPKQGIYLGGRESEIYTEGIAQINEDEITKDVLGGEEGEKYVKNTVDSSFYYILAMEKAKKGSNFAQVYDYIYEKKYEENLIKNKYHLLSEREEKEAKKIEEKSKTGAMSFSKNVCRRIFRGFNPKEGGKYFTKDMVYFKGKIAAQKMKEKGEDKYLYMSRIDPILIPSLKKLGAYASEKGLELARSAVKNIWKEKGWVVDYHENKKWFDDNVQTDRHWAYAKEFLDKDLKEMKSDKRIEKLYDKDNLKK